MDQIIRIGVDTSKNVFQLHGVNAAEQPVLRRKMRRKEMVDDWGLQPLDGNARHHLLEILEDRYGQRSTLVTNQLPVAHWHQAINDPTYADAILDRLVHNAHRLELEGESMRRPAAAAA